MVEHIESYNPNSGQPYSTAPTPKTSSGTIDIDDKSNKIATTEWVKSAIAGKNVGDEWHSFTGKIPAGGVPYCGQIVTRATYADLWNYVQEQGLVKTEIEWQSLNISQNGNVPFYSDGDGSTTFRMPKIVGYIKGSASTDGVGAYIAEGLPNITGQDTLGWANINYGLLTNGGERYGALSGAKIHKYGETTYNGSTNLINENVPYGVGFDASLSNAIYGNSSHVTPETITVLFGVYAYGELTVTGSTTTDALATGLANVESRIHVLETWKSGSLWYRKYSDGLIEQGGYIDGDASVGFKTITFQKAFATGVIRAVYNIGCHDVGYGAGYNWTCIVDYVTKTAMNISVRDGQNKLSLMTGFWYACGY